MKEKQNVNPGDRALVARALSNHVAEPATVEPPDAMALAALLDGKLGEAEQAEVEARLAASAEALDLYLAARAARAEETSAAPTHVVERARQIVRPQPRPATEGAPGLTAWLGRLLPSARLATAAAMVGAVMLASVAGFELGRAGHAVAFAPEVVAVDDAGAAFDPLPADIL